MNEQLKLLKFKVLVENISQKLSRTTWTDRRDKLGPLHLIFDNNNANDYLKLILSESIFISFDSWSLNELIRKKTSIINELVNNWTQPYKRHCVLVFIFWSLFGLAVDKNDYEEKASTIADFAYMLKISGETIRDIIKVIKVILDDEEWTFEFETDEVPNIFEDVLVMFKANNTDGRAEAIYAIRGTIDSINHSLHALFPK